MTRAAQVSLAAALVLALVPALAACGKQGNLRAPDDAEEAYTYPRSYPNPATVVPPDDPGQEPAARPRSREVLEGAGDISVFPNLRRTTTTYGTSAPQ